MKKISTGGFGDKIKGLKFGNLFYDNRFVMVFSVITSFLIWIFVSSNNTESRPVTISDIPVTIQLSDSAVQDGLRIFSGKDIKAKVDITGNRLIVGQVTKADIQVVAQQASTTITSPGNYLLELTPKKAGVLMDYEFASSVDPAFTTVVVDRYREAEFEIEPLIHFTADPEYYVGATVLSSPKVTLSGPEAEISKVKRAAIKGEIPGELKSTAYVKLPVILYDTYGEVLSGETISTTASEIQATVPILKRKEIPLSVKFDNKPDAVNLSGDRVKITPSSLEIAGPADEMDKLEIIELPAVDLRNADIKNNHFDLKVDLPSGCKSLNNVYSAKVSVNMQGFKEKTLWVTDFAFVNVPAGKNAAVSAGGINVKLVGPSSAILPLRASDVSARIDLMQKEDASGYMEVSAEIISKGNSVWAYGKYLTNVKVE